MPKVNWGIKSDTIDDFDRSKQYAPYTGPIPPNAVYQWRIKVAQSVAPTRDKLPQLRVGLELVPRKGFDEDKYMGFWTMKFLHIGDNNAFAYAPFCDAIGVTGREFTGNTITDEEGNVKKIGKWRHDGKTLILGQLEDYTDNNGTVKKTVGWVGALNSEPEYDEEEDDEDYVEEDEDAYEEEEEETPRRPTRKAKVATSARRRRVADDDDF